MLKNAFLPRLLKKVQMQGAAPIFDGYPPRREAYLARTSQRRTHQNGYAARGHPP